jgi:hypothetical protein
MGRKHLVWAAALTIFMGATVLCDNILPDAYSRSPLLSIGVVVLFLLISPLIRKRLSRPGVQPAVWTRPRNWMRSNLLLWTGFGLTAGAFVWLFFSLMMVGQARLGIAWVFPPAIGLIIAATSLLTLRLIARGLDLIQGGRNSGTSGQ